MTHFANADCDDDSFTYEQLAPSEGGAGGAAGEGRRPPTVHAAARRVGHPHLPKRARPLTWCAAASRLRRRAPHTAPGLERRCAAAPG